MQTTQNLEPATIADAPASKPAKKSQPKRRMARPLAEKLDAAPPPTSAPDAGAAAPTPRPTSKAAAVIALLERAEGATLAELVEATGWLPHTTRAALTGFKKRGHVIERSKRGDVTCYNIIKPA